MGRLRRQYNEFAGSESNGINLATFENAVTDRSAVRSELGLVPSDFVVVQVARLDYLKDHSTAVRAIERATKQNPDIRLLIVGEGPERQRLEAEIAQRKQRSHVQLLGQRKDVPRILAAADACLLTSISEGIPLTLIEGMAAGLPVVSTNVGGVSEVVEDDATAMLAPSGNDEQLANSLVRLAGDVELRTRLGRQ